jgi:hypothetical protein
VCDPRQTLQTLQTLQMLQTRSCVSFGRYIEKFCSRLNPGRLQRLQVTAMQPLLRLLLILILIGVATISILTDVAGS